MIPVQQQANGVDCGVSALAFCQYVLAVGLNPTNILFDRSKMRRNLMSCLESNNMTRFPTLVDQSPKQCKSKAIKLRLYCSCRMHWVPSDEKIKSRYVLFWIHSQCSR